MKLRNFLAVLALALFATFSASAQATATGAVSHFSINGSAVGFLGTGTSTAASIAGADFSMTPAMSIGYEQVTVPSVASYDFGVVKYTKPLSSLVGKKLTAKFTFDASKVNVTFVGGAGKLIQSEMNIARVAETGGAYISYPITSSGNLSLQVVGVQVLHAGVQTSFITTPTTEAIQSGLQIKF